MAAATVMLVMALAAIMAPVQGDDCTASVNEGRDEARYWQAQLGVAAVRQDPVQVARDLAIVNGMFFDIANVLSGNPHAPAFTTPTVPPSSSCLHVNLTLLIALSNLQNLLTSNNFPTLIQNRLGNFPPNYADVFPGEVALGESIAQYYNGIRLHDATCLAGIAYPVTGKLGFGQFSSGASPAPPAMCGSIMFATGTSSESMFASSGAVPPPAFGSDAFQWSMIKSQAFGSIEEPQDANQTEVAAVWYLGPNTLGPAAIWIRIAADFMSALDPPLALADEARVYWKVSEALADAGIMTRYAQVKFNSWNPQQAIASQPGLSLWRSRLLTPTDVPSFVSMHTAFAGAASGVLSRLFPDARRVVVNGPAVQFAPHVFHNFSEAADEVVTANLYQGIHFDFDAIAGLTVGNAVAANVNALP
ncbi:unnamed protein product (mitochondrion) [Plasmodiophora brassicae]|uniref:Phosphatidic acid phosphatase type 2/haloperoxidase domain-containing protein n=2 Tax=Plasmodiophora brassicae TaxID=37360 RepID=A0A3P3YHB7_PLABS|nr:unnamed protein product [Plasmodiophora brassicae]